MINTNTFCKTEKKCTAILIFSVLSVCVFSQPDPVKFGKIDKSLLEMKVYDQDTTADAVIVCDYGVFDPNSISFVRNYRLKVLKKSGCDRANFVFSIRSRSNIKGCTYNLVNGEIVKDKLKKESIFEEEVTRYHYRYRVTLPNVQVGSVIDLEIYFNGIPYTWYFQSDIPVMWSELRIPSFSRIGIQKNYFGFQPLFITEDDRWVGKDMPALSSEPFMNNLDNFLTKFELEFTSAFGFTFATTWDEVNNLLLHESSLGEELKTIFFMNSDAKAIADSCKTQKAKMKAAYETIKKKMKWNEQEVLFPKNDIRYTMSKGAGNAGDINTALVLLLRKLDIETFPVALSTRSNGMLTFFYPTFDKLNYLVALAKIDNDDILLDATEENLPAGYLPERCINGNGRIVDNKVSIWTELKPGGTDKSRVYSDLKLNDDGMMNGNISCAYYEYAGYLFRKNYSTFNDKTKFIKNIERENPGMKITNSSVQGIDSIYIPVNAKYAIEYNSNSDITDTTITFLPIILERIINNPFKLDERKIPVDFIYPKERKYTFRIEIPEKFKVASFPAPVNFVLPENKGRFTYKVSVQDSLILIQCNITILKPTFTQVEYPYIKQLYAEIVNKESEPVILKKK